MKKRFTTVKENSERGTSSSYFYHVLLVFILGKEGKKKVSKKKKNRNVASVDLQKNEIVSTVYNITIIVQSK